MAGAGQQSCQFGLYGVCCRLGDASHHHNCFYKPDANLLWLVQASTAVNLGFMVFIAGWIMQVVIIFGYPYTPQYYGEVVIGTVLFTLLPW